MRELTPKQIVRELDKYIVGQAKAKKAVAIAMRNRWRRQQVNGSMRDEIMPNNIIICLLYTSPSPRDKRQSRMPSSA